MTSTQNEDELDKILYEFGNHVWECAQNHSGWSQEGAQAALQAYITRECARKVLEELEALKLNTGWTADDYRSVLNERIAELRAAIKEVGGA